jgi:hypothetical protein
MRMDFDWLWSGSASDRAAAENARQFAWIASAHAFEFARAAERRGLKDLSLVFEMAALQATEIERPRGRGERTASRSQGQRNLRRWHVTRFAGRAARNVGFVHAVDAPQAIRIAIEKFDITDPEKRKRLAARRIA